MTHTYTTAEAAIVASALAVAVEQQIAAGLIPMPGEPKRFVAFGEMSELRNLVQDAAPSAQQAAGSIAELVKPTARFMWTSLFTNTATGIKFSLGTDKRGDVDVMSNELLESPEIDAAKVYEVAVLKRADYEILLNELDMVRSLYEGAHADRMALAAATPAQPIAPTDEALVALLDGYARDGTRGYQHYVERIIAWADARKVAQPIAVSAPTDEQEAFDDLYNTGIKPWSQRIPPNSYRQAIADAMQCELNELRPIVAAARAAAPIDSVALNLDAQLRAVVQERDALRAAAQAGGHGAPNLIEAISALDMLFPDGCQEPGALVRFSDVNKIAYAYIDSRPRSEDSRAEVLEAKLEASEESRMELLRLLNEEAGGGTFMGEPVLPKRADVSEMVNRFLGWPLPKTFAPDCGISFDGRKDDDFNRNKSWPIGTNLFSADEAKAMFEHCLASTTPQKADNE